MMISDLCDRNLPTQHGVTLSTVRTKFPPVNVSVAVSTIFAHIGKNRFCMTLKALHSLMQSSQWIPSFVVIELRYRTNGTPGARGVTIFARNSKRTVRASGV